MTVSDRKHWMRAAILVGLVYFAVTIAFSVAARSAPSSARETWNRLAFVVSGIIFTSHIAYEHFRLRSTTSGLAWHTSAAVALGAFALALLANVHDLWSPAGYRSRMLIALIAWPSITGVPAFIVAMITAAGLTLTRRQT